MLAKTTVTNTESTVYTVPAGNTMFIYLDTFLTDGTDLVVKVNSDVYYQTSTLDNNVFNAKLILDENDTIAISTTGTANVFVHGFSAT